MNIVHFQHHGINLKGGFQFWSNPSLSETEKAIPIVLSRPTLLDLIALSMKFGASRLIRENNEMLASGELSIALHHRNATRLNSIATGVSSDSRDLLDIDFLLKAGYITINEIISEMQKCNPHMSYETAVYYLTEKPIQKNDEGILSVGVNRANISEKIKLLESDIAREFKQQECEQFMPQEKM